MSSDERKLSDYIDSLNEEKKPEAYGLQESSHMESLFETVRLTKSLKEPAMPDQGFSKKLVDGLQKRSTTRGKKKVFKKRWYFGGASVAAVLILALFLSILSPLGQGDIVQAMEGAFQDVNAYHGVLEIVQTNAQGDSHTQAKMEVWADQKGNYYVKGIQGVYEGVMTANNGDQKWQIQSDEKQVQLFPAFPDAYGFSFEIGKEIENAKSAVEVKNIGRDSIAGRAAIIVEVTPKGGMPYRLWIDEETNMPLQRQSAMENSIQYQLTYSTLEFIDEIPEELQTYRLPEGYKEVDTNPIQIVSSLEEAAELTGFEPKVLAEIPEGYTQGRILVEDQGVRLNYHSKNNQVMIMQKKAADKLQFSSMATYGRIGDQIVEIQSPLQDGAGVLGGGVYSGSKDITSIRWQQGGYEFAIIGDVTLEELNSFIQGYTQETLELSLADDMKPEVEVPVDLETEKADQQSADAGHSIYKLDPVYAAQVFVSLDISPEGIEGDYPIGEDELKVIHKDEEMAIVAVNSKETTIVNVYLQRLVRQDSTGIWTVIGYDTSK